MKEISEKEIKGPQNNPRIIEYHKTTLLGAKTDEVPWCSSFVNWTMREAGFKGTDSAAAASWAKWGVKSEPVVGAVVMVLRGGKSIGHVGFYLGEGKTPDRIKVLGGNQGDAVSIAEFPRSYVFDYRMPAKWKG